MRLFGNRKGASHIQKKDENQKKTTRILLIIAVCLVALAVGAYAAVKMIVRPVTIKKTPNVQTTSANPAASEVETERMQSHIDGVYNVLICGTDNDGYRTDTIIVAHLDCNSHSAALMSIPRDTVVIRGDNLSKINSVYGGGKEEGMERLSKVLEEMLGFPMDAYLLVDLEGFKASVDMIGGVWFDVPQDMFYEDPTQDLYINLKQGYQLLDGEHAMQLVRYRKGYLSQDIQRTSVQQDFLFALANQCIQELSLSKISGFARIFKTYVTTDMTTGNMLYFASEVKKCSKDNLRSYTPQGAGATINGISYYPLFDWSVLEIVNESFNPYEEPILASEIFVVTPNMAERYDLSKNEPQPQLELPEELQEEEEQSEPPAQQTDLPPTADVQPQPAPQPTEPVQEQPQEPIAEQPPVEWQPDGVIAEWGYDPSQRSGIEPLP